MSTEINRLEQQIAVLTQKVDDILSSRSDQNLITREWRETIERKIDNMERNVNKIMLPYKITSWIVSITGTAFIAELIKKTIEVVFFKHTP